MTPEISTDESAQRAADIVQRSFQEFHQAFRAITRRAMERFERREWDGIRRDTVRRMGLHARSVNDTLTELRDEIGPTVEERAHWAAMKEAFTDAILGTDDCELAQTFFNSLTRRVFSHIGVDQAIDYLAQEFPVPYRGWEMASTRMYAVREINWKVFSRILRDAGFHVSYARLEHDAKLAADIVERSLKDQGIDEIEAIDFLRPLFIRSKAAYLIGRVRYEGGSSPVVLAVLNRDEGLVLDAVVQDEDELSVIFSFARWYFHADLQSPREVIGFLTSILPRKRVAELYISLGYHKHGKTEFYRDLARHIRTTSEAFDFAPGKRGMVMSVFTLPGYEYVFKVIKDHFPPPKNTTRERVRERYRQVQLHDRVGRLVDFQEFEHLEFRPERFTEPLLEELLKDASRSVRMENGNVAFDHVYVGRRVRPLDLYLDEIEPERREAAVVEWGTALKELAAANIFAGDMMLKNFGVTRHGRVVFYDYDELCALVDCRFRRMPEARNDQDEMAAEPWFGVAENDVFPEELETFLGLRGEARELFRKHHGDLFDCELWRSLQERNRRGEMIDFYPYSSSLTQALR